MQCLRLACVLGVTMLGLGAGTTAEAKGKPSFVPPADPPSTLQQHACSLLPSAAAAWVPFCK